MIHAGRCRLFTFGDKEAFRFFEPIFFFSEPTQDFIVEKCVTKNSNRKALAISLRFDRSLLAIYYTLDYSLIRRVNSLIENEIPDKKKAYSIYSEVLSVLETEDFIGLCDALREVTFKRGEDNMASKMRELLAI